MHTTVISHFVGVFLLFAGIHANAGEAAALNARLALGQGCVVRLSQGPRMRIPSEMLDKRQNCSATVPADVELLRVVLNYPEMTPGEWVGLIDRHFAQLHHTDVLHKDHFQVNILYIFYPAQIKNATIDQWTGVEPQVWQIKKRQYSDGDLMGWSNETRVSDSLIKPLRQLSFYKRPDKPSPYRAHGDVYDRSLGFLIQPVGADYDLWMDCDEAIECEGRVQINASHIQYRFQMPYEAALHAGDLISSLNRMIDGWLVK